MVNPTGGVGSGCGPDDQVIEVEPEQWLDAVAAAIDEGFTWFDSLIGIDEILRPRPSSSTNRGEGEQLRLVVRVVAFGTGGPCGRQVQVRLDRDQPRIESLTPVLPGAAWYEREVHDFFGVDFVGGDATELLWHHAAAAAAARAQGQPEPARHPLLKDALLQRRIDTVWPGGKDPDDGKPQASRRRTLPPGVPDPEVMADPAATPVEVVASLAGGRVRRRR